MAMRRRHTVFVLAVIVVLAPGVPAVWYPSGRKTIQPVIFSATVLDPNGRPVPDAAVSLRGVGYPILDAISDADGWFKLQFPPKVATTEQYDVPYLIARDRVHNLAVAVKFEPNETDDLKIRPSPGVVLSGKITDEQHKGIPGTELSLIFISGRMGHRLKEEATKCDPDGRYEIRAVPPDHSYLIETRAPGYGSDHTDRVVADSKKGRIELPPIVLRVANLDISGVVVDAEGRPIADAFVSTGGRGQAEERVNADAQGRFTIHGVCPGPIEVRASSTGRSRRFYGTVQATGGATAVKVVVSPIESPDSGAPDKPQSLIGKPLPALADFGIETPADSYKNQMILLCVFDAGQRPSRNGVAILARRAGELKQQGVTVIAVQVGDVDSDTLRQWLKEQSATLPTGSIKGDAARTTFAWGVQALPWLILTDKNHVVRAEGFAVGDLDKVLQEVK